jgi:nucleoside-diphosphate-sugar epimerase
MEKLKAMIVKLLTRLPGGHKLLGMLVRILRGRQPQARPEARPEASQLDYSPSGKVRVLVTGNAGKLGSLVTEYLKKAGYDVVGFDIKVNPSENLSNYELLRKRMAGCQFVVHSAAIPHPNHGTIEDYFEANVVGSLNVMRAAAVSGVKRFIYFSSVAYYGANIKGKLWPDYFPIDEAHPIASTPGRSEGMLDSYNQSKVMAEELLAWYGTNRIFEAISLRLAPANKKSDQYPADGSWQADPRYRRGGFWTNVDPDTVGEVVKFALEAPGEFWYEPFNICDKYAPECINVKAFLAEEYPDVPLKCDLSDNSCLITPAKAERVLGFKPCEDIR